MDKINKKMKTVITVFLFGLLGFPTLSQSSATTFEYKRISSRLGYGMSSAG